MLYYCYIILQYTILYYAMWDILYSLQLRDQTVTNRVLIWSSNNIEQSLQLYYRYVIYCLIPYAIVLYTVLYTVLFIMRSRIGIYVCIMKVLDVIQLIVLCLSQLARMYVHGLLLCYACTILYIRLHTLYCHQYTIHMLVQYMYIYIISVLLILDTILHCTDGVDTAFFYIYHVVQFTVIIICT